MGNSYGIYDCNIHKGFYGEDECPLCEIKQLREELARIETRLRAGSLDEWSIKALADIASKAALKAGKE